MHSKASSHLTDWLNARKNSNASDSDTLVDYSSSLGLVSYSHLVLNRLMAADGACSTKGNVHFSNQDVLAGYVEWQTELSTIITTNAPMRPLPTGTTKPPTRRYLVSPESGRVSAKPPIEVLPGLVYGSPLRDFLVIPSHDTSRRSYTGSTLTPTRGP